MNIEEKTYKSVSLSDVEAWIETRRSEGKRLMYGSLRQDKDGVYRLEAMFARDEVEH